jgi:hypothetical protein
MVLESDLATEVFRNILYKPNIFEVGSLADALYPAQVTSNKLFKY